jgi:hypothetical protein
VLDHGISWRRAWAVLGVVVALLAAVVVVFRTDGFDAVDATVPRATRWFVNEGAGQIVLVDGFAGRALMRLAALSGRPDLEIAQSASSVALIDRNAGTAREIDTVNLRLGPPQPLGLAASPTTVVGTGQAGLVAVDTQSADAVLLPRGGGDTVPFDVGAAGSGTLTQIAPDGAVWTLAAGRLARVTSVGEQTVADGLVDARFAIVGNRSLVLDAGRRRARFGDGGWVVLPTDADASEILVQESGPQADCGWVIANDDLWCVGTDRIDASRTIDGLDADGADRFAVAGDAAALVRRAPSQIVRLDWRAGTVLEDVVADVPPGSELAVSASTDLIWVDQLDGPFVWAINPWGVSAIRKNDQSSPLLGESGEVIEAGSGATVATQQQEGTVEFDREPDDNGIDDPPVAVDDPVTARSGAQVQVPVTANDYDPDGEAIVLVGVGTAQHGTAEIGTATTVSYQPESGYVGVDRFEYTIADGNGTEATATVTIELLPVDAPNQAPIGTRDTAETGPGSPVVVDVLLNDVDPERDPLRIGSFTRPDFGGTVSEVTAPSGLPGLRFEPDGSASGTLTFTYRPVDTFGAEGDTVVVSVDIAQATDENRPPIVRPDGLRVRRGSPFRLAVLANDRDPDGDPLRVSVPDPLPPGIQVGLVGNELSITAVAGSASLNPFTYHVDDGHGHDVTGSVLVAVISEVEPNRPPIANADAATAVVGTTQLVDVLLNDSDPDGDALIIVDVFSETGAGVGVQGDRIRYSPPSVGSVDEARIDRFTYTISDGNGNSARGEVTVRVLPEPIAAPPFAQDDAATTEVDVPVTLDVLRNDGDPSGEPPILVGTPGCAGVGSARVTDDSKVTYTPPRGRAGVFSCTYEVSNSQGLRADARIVISVIEPQLGNEPPLVEDEDVGVVVGDTIDVDVLANDVDPDGPSGELRVLSSTTPFIGTAVRNGGVISYTAAEQPGPVSITYQVGDVDGGVATGRLVIRVREPDPEPPTALDDRKTITGPGVRTSIDVLANDGDPDGPADALRIESAELVGGTDGGVLSVGTRSLTFEPRPEFVGDLVAEYAVVDPDGLTATATAILTVLEAPNRPPVAMDDTAEVVNGGTVEVPIAFNDEDLDGDELVYSLEQPPDPGLGTASVTEGVLRFDAVPGADGVATMSYRVDDGEATDDATVSITVLPCAVAPPEAPNVSLRTGYQQPISIDLANYARNGTIVDVGPPLGAASGVYTPPPGENGNVSFNYTVRNSCRIQATGLVTIDVNQDPIAAPYEASIGRIDPWTIPVTNLATDAEPLRIVGLEGAPPWITLIDDARALQVVPNGQSGRVDMIAIVADPGGLQARVPIALQLVNLAPIAIDDGDGNVVTGPVVIRPLDNDVDPDGDAISLLDVPTELPFPNGGVGTIERLGNGDVRIDPGSGAGRTSFTYTIVDALGAPSAPATVTVVVNGPPVANDMTVTVPAGSTLSVTLDAVDPEGGVLGATLGDEKVVPFDVSLTGLELTVTAPGAEGTTRTLSYTVTDDRGAGDTGTITLVVGPPPTTTTTTTVPPTTTTTVPPTTTTTVPPTTTTTTTTTTTSTTTTTVWPPRGRP